MNILVWHVHGSWTTAFVQGPHTYLLPVLPDRGPDGLGRARTWDWPSAARELSRSELAGTPVDLVVLQRASELELTERWLGRRPGIDIPAVYLEHNAPEGEINAMRHLLAGRSDIPVVHVTWFNQLFWDCGRAPTVVIEHGVVDPGHRYQGDLARAVVAINEPVRRARVVGADLLSRFAEAAPIDLFGMRSEELGGTDVPQDALHAEMARRRVYLHPFRWTSLGLTLIEAMQLGMPVVGLATTEASEAVPPGAGVLSNRLDVLDAALRHYISDPEAARAAGDQARQAALARYSLKRFLDDWDRLIDEVTR